MATRRSTPSREPTPSPYSKDLMQRVASRVAHMRASAGHTQEAFASALGIATKNLQRLEGGKQNLTLGTLSRIALLLGVDVLDFLKVAPEGPSRRVSAAWTGDLVETGATLTEAEEPGSIPATTLRAAGVALAAGKAIEAKAHVQLPGRRAAEKGAFLVRVVGSAMDPKLPDGSWCLFRAPAAKPAWGHVVLAAVNSGDSGPTFVIRQIDKKGARGGVTLSALVPGYPTLELRSDEVHVLADFVRIVPPRSA